MSETNDGRPDHGAPRAADRVGLAKSRAKVAKGLFGERATSAQAEVRVGRYRVAERLGAGGMGVVYAATDDELERRVALKVLTGQADAAAQTTTRLQREAKAMARMSHANVATIYEVGNHEGEVFIAMEYVAGQTLRRWLQDAPGRAEALRVLVGAARGLAAAHAAGIVHRDFKPENVMVTTEGSAKILDFGVSSSVELPTEADAARTGEKAALTSLTRTGGIVGTPAYMAPEQLAGDEVGPKSDQYSFFVVAYEILCGQRPYTGRSVEELALRQRDPPPASPRLAGHLERTLRRGLQLEPGQRFASMDEVAELLQRDPAARRRRRVAAAGVVGLAATVAFVAARATTPQRCLEGKTRVEETWTTGHRPVAASAFAATGLAHADNAWARAQPGLDGWAARWADTHRQVCEATRVFETQSEALLAVRAGCLDRTWQRFEALAAALREPDGSAVANATRAVASLPSPEPCATATAEDAELSALPAEAQTAVAAVDAQIAAAQALLHLGRWPAAQTQAEAAVDRASTLAHPPTKARALATAARARAKLNGDLETLAMLERARRETLAVDDMEMFVRVSVSLAAVLEGSPRATERAQTTLELAEGAVVAAGDPAGLRVDWLVAHSHAAEDSGDYDGARASLVRAGQRLGEDPHAPQERVQRVAAHLAHLDFERSDNADAVLRMQEATASCEAALGVSHPDCAMMHAVIAGVFFDTLQWKEALAEADLAVDRLVAALGPEHPWVGTALLNRGGALMRMLRFDDSQAALERALRIEQARSAEVGPDESPIRSSLAHLYEARGQLQDALTEFERVHEILLATGRAESMDVGHTLYNRARVLTSLGQHAEALAKVRAATAHYDRIGASDHRAAIASLAMEGVIVEQLGDAAAAARAYERAVERSAAHHGVPHPDTAAFHLMLGMTLLDVDDLVEGRRHVEAALSVLQRAEGSNPIVESEARFQLAKLLWPKVDERPRALELARQAKATFAELGRDTEAEAEAWLAERGG
ncbi:MAG: serine/threonine-protein kinase [Myxococcota bacterium]